MAYASKKAAQDYNNEYQKENYDRITILRSKGQKEKLKDIANSKNQSVNEFINQAIDEKLKRLKIEL